MAADFYDLLEVSRDATADDLKRAYRRLARQLHPDTNPDPAAEERFKEITVAYEVLSDPEKRQRYDRYGAEGLGGDPFGFGGRRGINDIFDAFFGGGSPFGGGGRRGPAGPPRGQDIEVVADLVLRGGGVRRAPLGVGAHRGGLRDLRGHRRQAGHASRSPASSAPAPDRCSGCARASSARWSPTPSARAAAARAR